LPPVCSVARENVDHPLWIVSRLRIFAVIVIL
jgi:hypothetical protein